MATIQNGNVVGAGSIVPGGSAPLPAANPNAAFQVPTKAPTGQTSTAAPAATPVVSSAPAQKQVENIQNTVNSVTQTTLAQDQARAVNQGKPGYDVFGNPVVATPPPTGGSSDTTKQTPEEKAMMEGMNYIYDASGNQHAVPIGTPIPNGYTATNPNQEPKTPVTATAQTDYDLYKQYNNGTYGRYTKTNTGYEYAGTATQLDFQGAQAQQATTQALLNIKMGGAIPITADQQAQVTGLAAQWQDTINKQQVQNANLTGAMGIFQSLHGGNGQIDTASIIADTIQKGAAIISDLQTKQAAAVAAMKMSFQNDDLAKLQKDYADYTSNEQAIQTHLDSMSNAVKAQQKIQNAQIDQQAIDTAIGTQITSGVTDPTAILAALTAKGIKATAQQVNDTLANLQPDAKSINDLMKTITANGASAAVIKAVGAAKTLNEAYAAAGTYAAGGTGVIAQFNLYRAGGGQLGFDDWTQAYHQAISAGTTLGKGAGQTSPTAGTLKDAIVGQESQGSYTTVNKDSGALGKYQIMPVHLADIGLDPKNPADIQKFINSPVLQDNLYASIIADLQVQYNGNEQKVIAAYYGGGGAAAIVGTPAADKPQGDKGQYPSINAYVKQVQARMVWNTNDATPPPNGDAGNQPYGNTGRTPNYIWQSALTLALDKTATPQKFLGGLSGSSAAGLALKDAITNKSAALMTAAGVNQATLQQQFNANSTSINKQITYMNDLQRNLGAAHEGLNQVVSAFKAKGINTNDSTFVNSKFNDISKVFTDSGDIRAYQAALTEIGNEYSQVFSRGGLRNEKADARAQDIINGNITLGDLQKVTDELQSQGEIVVKNSIDQVASITSGGGAGEVAKFLAYVNNQPNDTTKSMVQSEQQQEAVLTTKLNTIKSSNPTMYTAASGMFTSNNPDTGQPYSAADILQAFPELAK